MKVSIMTIKILSICVFVMFLLTLKGNGSIVYADVVTGVEKGQKAPLFKLSTLDGNELDLESFIEDKAVLLVFGATWCPSCKHEIPLLKEYYNEFKDEGLKVLSVYIQESERKVGPFVKKNKIDYPVALDVNADVARLYNIRGIPLNIVLDKNGVIKYRGNRLPSKDIFQNLIVN